MPAVGGGAGGGTSLHQAFEGIFTATTVRQRAFKEGSLIGLQGSSGAPVGYLAPVDIPVNSPAPGTNNALWVSFGGSFAGVDRATFDAALARKANAASLANYLRTSTYNLEKARLESGITGNDNDISALQTAINNLPSEVGDVTRQQLTDAVEMLEQQIGNVSGPLFIYELWAKSKTTVLAASVPQGTAADLDWALEDDVPDALSVSGDFFIMPLFYRGHINCEVWQGDTLEDRVVLEVESSQQDSAIGDFNVGGLTFANWAWVLDQVVIDGVNVNRVYVVPSSTTATMLAGLEFRVYAEVALSRSDVTVNLDALTARVETAEADIEALESQTANIPITSDVLWATSGALPTTLTRGSVLATAWTGSDDLPDGVTVDGNFLNISENLRGELHIDVFNSANELIGRIPIDIYEGADSNFPGILPDGRIHAQIIEHPTDDTLLRFQILNTHARQGSTIVSGTTIRVYGVSALPRSQVEGITQEELIAALLPTSVDVFPKTVGPTKQDLLDTLFVLEFGKVFPPISNANRIIATFNGSPIYNGVLDDITDNMVLPMPITDMQADNIATNNRGLQFYDVNVSFRLNNEPATLASRAMKVAINRG